MDLVELQRKLLAAGRRYRPSSSVPYAFERRIMACLKAVRPEDAWVLWGRALWRAAAGSLILTVVLASWLLLPGQEQRTPSNLSQLYDSTLYAAAEQMSDPW